MRFKLLTLLFLSTMMVGKAQVNSNPSPVPSADEVLRAAYSRAAKEKKNVFVIFHASWCVWCHRMDTAMNDPLCKKFFTDNFVIEHLVVDENGEKVKLENPGAAAMRAKYGGEGQGIPFWLVFDKDGKLLADSKVKPGTSNPDGDNVACPATESEVAYFIKVLKQTSNLNAAQLEIVRKRFRENEH